MGYGEQGNEQNGQQDMTILLTILLLLLALVCFPKNPPSRLLESKYLLLCVRLSCLCPVSALPVFPVIVHSA